MTPLVIGIDPGTKQSAYVAWDGEFIQALGTVPNHQVLTFLRSIAPETCVVIENIVSYGQPVGVETLDTCVWVGRFFQRARDVVGPTRVSRLPRRAVKKFLKLKSGAGDKDVRAALIRLLDRHPEQWHNLKSHQWSALAIAVTWWNTERARQPLKQGRTSNA